MTRLVTDLKPSQLVLSKDGNLKVGFFDKIVEVNVVRDGRDRIVKSDKQPRLYIHIESLSDRTMVFEGPAKERRVQDGEDFKWVHETELFANAYAKYLQAKNEVTHDPYAEIEELKRRLAEKEASKANIAEEVKEEPLAPKKGRPKKEPETVE